jgi:hypothetical protein
LLNELEINKYRIEMSQVGMCVSVNWRKHGQWEYGKICKQREQSIGKVKKGRRVKGGGINGNGNKSKKGENYMKSQPSE